MKANFAETKAGIATPYPVFYKTGLSRTAITQRENNRKVVGFLKCGYSKNPYPAKNVNAVPEHRGFRFPSRSRV